MKDYNALRAQAERNPNSTAAIVVIKMQDMLNEHRAARREARRAFFKKILGRA